MKSRNPILTNSATFNGQAARTYGHPEYPASGAGHPGYAQLPQTETLQPRMTIDSVVSRTAVTLFLVVATATLTWIFLPDSTVSGEANW